MAILLGWIIDSNIAFSNDGFVNLSKVNSNNRHSILKLVSMRINGQNGAPMNLQL